MISNTPILWSPSVVVLIVTVIVVLISHLIRYQLILRNYYPQTQRLIRQLLPSQRLNLGNHIQSSWLTLILRMMMT
jgi:capsular polysaccharide biosynthesis protein